MPRLARRHRLAAGVLAAAGAALMLPDAGVAQGPPPGMPGGPGGGRVPYQPTTGLYLSGPKIKGFKLRGEFGNAGASGLISLTRRSKGTTERHSRTFEGGLRNIDFNRSLSKGTLKTKPSDGDAISLEFTPTRAARRVAMPEQMQIGFFAFRNCRGEDGLSRKGVLRGTLKVFAGRYFNTIRLQKVKATVVAMPQRTCDRPSQSLGPSVPTLKASGAGSPPSSGGQYTVQRLGSARTSHALFTQEAPMNRSITTEGDGSSFGYSDDAATATITGAGPLLAGTLTYTATDVAPGGGGSTGRVTGGIKGTFVTGTVRVPGPFNPFASLAVPSPG